MTFCHAGKASMRRGFKHISSRTSNMKNSFCSNLSSNHTSGLSTTIKNPGATRIKINPSNPFQNSNHQTFKKFHTASENQAKSTAKAFNSAPKCKNNNMKATANRNRHLLEDIKLAGRIMGTKIAGEILNQGEDLNNCGLLVYNWDDDGT